MKKISAYYLLLLFTLLSCGHSSSKETGDAPETVTTPVTLTTASTDTLVEYVELNATSTFLRKGVVKANAAGYITAVRTLPGKMAQAGEELFTLKTKEAQSIGNTINALDSTFKFSGTIHIKAGTTGFVTEVNHLQGDYVQEGEQLASINDLSSFVFVMSLPYELRPYIVGKKNVTLVLPDSTSLRGTISSITAVVDSASQTQNCYITVAERNLPANLIAKVRIVKAAKAAISLPKAAVLANETLTAFWVMKLLDSNTVVKVPVVKGMETKDRIEICSPTFSAGDQFVLTGNYGLGDTAKITIIRK